MGQFDETVDPEQGVTVTPSPALDPFASALAPSLMASAVPPPPSPAPIPMPTAPQAPAPPGMLQRSITMALLGLAAGLGPRGGGAGAAHGLMAGQLANEDQRQRTFKDQQGQYQQQQQEAIRLQQIQDVEQRAAAQLQEQRQAKLLQALQTIRTEIKTIPDKATYDQRIEGYANLLRGSGYRLDANWLRQAVPYFAPSAKQIAGDAITALFKNPLLQTQIKENPEAVAGGFIMVDLNGDGIKEKHAIQEVMGVAEMSFLTDEAGAPIGMAAGSDGPMANIALKAGLAQFRAENHREPTPKERSVLIEQARKTPKEPSPTAATDHNEAEEIADAIEKGLQPPVLTGLYRSGKAVRASLARRGYNLTTAQQDWTATQKFLSTANGTQQNRMRQAVDNASHSLDVIDQLAQQWQGGHYPLLNRGRLAAAQSGVLGPEAQKLATTLAAQISDITSELGNVYMGGNSPTDHALALAAKNLSADWSLPQLQAAIALARTNLRIRQNSMTNVGPTSIGGRDNQYAPPSPAGGTDETWERDPATGKMRKRGG